MVAVRRQSPTDSKRQELRQAPPASVTMLIQLDCAGISNSLEFYLWTLAHPCQWPADSQPMSPNGRTVSAPLQGGGFVAMSLPERMQVN